jgi:membrane fusion protein (multidrug efflux system)
MKKKKIILPTIFILALFSLFAFYKWRHVSPGMQMPETWVKTVAVQESSLSLEVKAIGTLTARGIDITPEMAGHVHRILFKDGSEVAKGADLYQLEDAIYQTKNHLAQAKLAFSKMNYGRAKTLLRKGVLAKQALEQAEADYKEKQADADDSAVTLAKLHLKAPFAGKVGKSQVSVGEYITVGQALVRLTDTKHLRVEYTLPETYVSDVSLGQTVVVKTAAYPQQRFYGKVAYISPTVSAENRALHLYAEIDNEKNVLTPGMFVNITQSLGTKARSLMIPARSLVPVLEGEQVYKIVDGKAYVVNVLTGKRDKEQVQVLEGLKIGDQIITDGQFKVKNGMPVKIQT